MEWPPPSEHERLRKYENNRKLWDGKHTEVYGDWWRVLREEYEVSHEIIFNFHKRLSTLWADLVFGDPPVFMAGEEDSPEQDTIDRITEYSGFSTVGYEGVIDVSRYGDAIFKLRLKDGQAFVQTQSPALWFPVVSRDDQREILYHVLAWTFTEGEGTNATEYLRAEIHEKGWIENRLYILKGDTIHEQIDLAAFFPNRLEREPTKLPNGFMVQHVPGLRASDEFYGKDDYGDVDSIILEREARAGQISRVQDAHSDPSMYGDEGYMTFNRQTGKWELQAGNFFPVPEGTDPPGYLTWDGKQDAQFTFMDKLKEDLYEISETTPTAFGASSTGYAESGTSLRLRMVPPLAKARRVRLRFDSVVKKTLILAAQLEAAWGVQDTTVPETINITWNDGLPNDPKEQAEIEATRRASGTTSIYSSIRRLDGGTDEEIQAEIDRIEEEEKAQAPAVTMPGLNLSLEESEANGQVGGNRPDLSR